MIIRVLSENEGWRLEKRTCGANVRTHYRQGRGEFVPKKTLLIGMELAKLAGGDRHDLILNCMSCIEIN